MTPEELHVFERIATALEQMALDRGPRLPYNGTPFDALLAGPEPPLPTPPPEYVVIPTPTVPQSATVALPPVQPFQFSPPTPAQAGVPGTVRWGAGMNHMAGHKPLKENNRGLYCPTKLQDGTWCQFTVKA